MESFLFISDPASSLHSQIVKIFQQNCENVRELSSVDEIPNNQSGSLNIIVVNCVTLEMEKATEVMLYCQDIEIPVIVIINEHQIASLKLSKSIEEIFVYPGYPGEFELRLSKLNSKYHVDLQETIIKHRHLFIDLEKYEVYVSDKKMALTYKEFQLLVLLASNPGHVYSREDLLSRIWEYDYLGGTRTVDVHVRRLRSKIEDSSNVFVETVWNVGYKFKVID
jgi:DNA-binding response OmpR family regulator